MTVYMWLCGPCDPYPQNQGPYWTDWMLTCGHWHEDTSTFQTAICMCLKKCYSHRIAVWVGGNEWTQDLTVFNQWLGYPFFRPPYAFIYMHMNSHSCKYKNILHIHIHIHIHIHMYIYIYYIYIYTCTRSFITMHQAKYSVSTTSERLAPGFLLVTFDSPTT